MFTSQNYNLTKVKMPPDDLGLCGTCQSSLVRHQGNSVTIQCRATSNVAVLMGSVWSKRTDNITSRVEHCNLYRHVNTPSVRDMEAVAWTLRTEKDGRKIGFEPPKEKD